MIVVGSMPRFSMGSGATPKGAVRSSATPTLVSLQGIVAPSLPSVQPVSTKGKVVFLFGTATKYPCFKFVVVAEGEPECKVLVKCNQPAPVSLSVDDMVLIGKAEARLTWKRNGQILESHVASRLADVELAVNLPGPKRKRSVESFFEVNFSLELCSSQAFRGIPVSLFIGAPPKKTVCVLDDMFSGSHAYPNKYRSQMQTEPYPSPGETFQNGGWFLLDAAAAEVNFANLAGRELRRLPQSFL